MSGLSGRIEQRKVNWILDLDIRSFFDSVSHEGLVRFVEHRIADTRIIRLIQKWLKAGVLEDGKIVTSEKGTGQGAVISPLLANVYLHYTIDLWAEQWRRQEAKGDMIIIRYADDMVLGTKFIPGMIGERTRILGMIEEREQGFAGGPSCCEDHVARRHH
jgi:RNA-directed DNA polymerase